jgi:hypothetical protein
MTAKKRAGDLIEGDRVDAATCPHLSGHSMAEMEWFTVQEIEAEGDGCVCVYYDYATCGYDPETLLEVDSDK